MNQTVRFVVRRDVLAPLLVLLHEDGADERQGLRIGRQVWPGAPMAGVRGHYSHRGGWRHLSEPDRNVSELGLEGAAVDRLAETIAACAKREPQLVEVIGIGIDGGADATLALLCRYPALLAGAILCRPSRRWSQTSLEAIERGNGVEVLVVTDSDIMEPALTAKLMLSLSGHHVEIRLSARADEAEVCRAWLVRELGENGGRT